MRYEGHEARSRQWRTPWPRHQRIALAAEYKARSGDRGHGLTARREDPTWRRVTVHSSKYLNNLIEQDHRAIKRRYVPMKRFKSFADATITSAGIELAHRIHKHQFSFGRSRPRRGRSLHTDWQRALAQ
jgi:transposase-like protein